MNKKAKYIIVFLIIFVLFFVVFILPFGNNTKEEQKNVQSEEQIDKSKLDKEHEELVEKRREEYYNEEDKKALENGKEVTRWGCHFDIGNTKHYYELTLHNDGTCYLFIQDGYSEPAPEQKGEWREDKESGKNHIIVFANDMDMHGEFKGNKLILDGKTYDKIDIPMRSD